MKKKIKPFIKWAGGKTQLLSELKENLKDDIEIYVELFVGGGTLFFNLLENFENTSLKKIIINDINEKLIITYRTIRDSVEELIKMLNEIQNQYNNLETLEKKSEFFYSIRKEFNSKQNDKLKISRDFIFLNKTCFNGLYRENSKGEFNVPFGKKKQISIFDEYNLREISKKLNLEYNGEKIVEIYNGDFKKFEEKIEKNIFFYIDPPYRPITKNGFTDYNKSSFNDKNQIELANFCKKIHKKKGSFLLNNSDPKNLDENDNFFDELYKSFYIKRVLARRSINSKGDSRGKITELLIKNYENKISKRIVSKNLKLFLEKKGEAEEMNKNFESFLEQLKDTNTTLDFFVNFEKVRENINKISLKLNQLNYLLGKNDLKSAINEVYEENNKAFEVLNSLIAVRDKKTKTVYNGKYCNIEDFFGNPEKIYEFIKLTKLEDVFKDKEIRNLVDYVYGIEVGLDTNARKNRSGDNMGKIVEEIFKSNNITYLKEIYSTNYEELNTLGEDTKRFDFVIETQNKMYLIEVNFYSSGGSKLNEVARAYTELAPKINKNEKFEFVWITDGKGWLTAKNKLQEAYNNIPSVYNLTTINEFIKKIKCD